MSVPVDDDRFGTGGAALPHGGGPVLVAAGTPAAPAAIFLHGRGGSAEDILSLAEPLELGSWTRLAPQAAGRSWYPRSFLSPREANQPGLDSAHAVIESLMARLAALGTPAERVALIGFSQGACLALDHACRFPRRYRAVVAFTGGLIGDAREPFAGAGALASTPISLSAGDPDPHVPWQRVEASARHLTELGALVSLDRYPGAPHAVLPQAIARAKEVLRAGEFVPPS